MPRRATAHPWSRAASARLERATPGPSRRARCRGGRGTPRGLASATPRDRVRTESNGTEATPGADSPRLCVSPRSLICIPWLLSAITTKMFAPGRARCPLQSGSTRQAASTSSPNSFKNTQTPRIAPPAGAWRYVQPKASNARAKKIAAGHSQSRPEITNVATNITRSFPTARSSGGPAPRISSGQGRDQGGQLLRSIPGGPVLRRAAIALPRAAQRSAA